LTDHLCKRNGAPFTSFLHHRRRQVAGGFVGGMRGNL
jgi:hypothetical protein